MDFIPTKKLLQLLEIKKNQFILATTAQQAFQQYCFFRLRQLSSLLFQLHICAATPYILLGCKEQKMDLGLALQVVQCSGDESHRRPFQYWQHSKCSHRSYAAQQKCRLVDEIHVLIDTTSIQNVLFATATHVASNSAQIHNKVQESAQSTFGAPLQNSTTQEA